MDSKTAIQLAYIGGYEDAVERLRIVVREVCDARAKELPAEAASMAFTRDRILFAIADIAEKAAVKRVALERSSDPKRPAVKG